ncbi:MAG: aldose 1-epimerase family protein [Bacteroidaceae bacterium]|nr:aldose 1-epimerase family protein [Bacteroidaceae bacterium]
MTHILQNRNLSITINEKGAELQRILRKPTQEILWSGDARYWHGQSPILFPSVGSCANGKAYFQGEELAMPKHGVVHGMQFSVTEKTEDSITLSVTDNAETRTHYPYAFSFRVTYKLQEDTIAITFEVENPNDTELPYQLGAHPAFLLPQFNEQDEVHGYLGFDIQNKLVSNGLKPGGLLWPEGSFDVPLNQEHLLPLDNHTFDCDTILDSRGQAKECTLYDKDKQPLVRVQFDSPILALWAPCGGCAPFVCIEPWWGCCDKFDYKGEFAERPWGRIVAPGEIQKTEYSITILR